MSERESKLDHALLLTLIATAFTGLYARVETTWILPYRINIIVHPLLGTAYTALFIYTALKGRSRAAIAMWALVTAFVIIAVGLFPPPRMYFLILILVLSGAVFIYMTRRRFVDRTWGGPWRTAATIATWYSVAFVLLSGMGILFHFADGDAKSWFQIHNWTGVVLILLIPVAMFRRRSAAFYVVGAVLIVIAGALPKAPVWHVNLSTIPLERRSPELVDVLPSAQETAGIAFLDNTESCGESNLCHPSLVEEHLLTNHNISYQPEYFQKNLDLMSEEIGEHNTFICAGCHTPQAVFDSNLTYRDFEKSNNMSCTFCHSVSNAGANPGKPRTTWYEIRPDFGHLSMFDPSGGPMTTLNRLLLLLNVPGHARAFNRDIIAEDRFCNACHHAHMPKPRTKGLLAPSCVKCHMQPQEVFGGVGSQQSHLFLGAATAPTHVLGHRERLDLIRGWAEGDIIARLDGWEDLWQLRYSQDDPYAKTPWLNMMFVIRDPPVTGEVFSFEVLTTNILQGHPFPGAPLDLTKAWLEVEVTDGDGRLLFQSGGLDEEDQVFPGTRTLGGKIIGRDGKPIVLNRVWQIGHKIVERSVSPGRHTRDRFTFRIPPDFEGSLHLRAAWNYRKLNPEFLRWAKLPHDQWPIPLVMGSASFEYQVSGGPPQ